KHAEPIAEGENEFVCGTSAGPFGDGSARRDLLDIVRAEDPDVVHLHSVFTTLGPGAVNALRAMKPTVYTMHDIRPLHSWGLQDRVLRDSPELTRWIRGPNGASTPARRLKHLLRAPSRRRLLTAYPRLDRMIV